MHEIESLSEWMNENRIVGNSGQKECSVTTKSYTNVSFSLVQQYNSTEKLGYTRKRKTQTQNQLQIEWEENWLRRNQIDAFCFLVIFLPVHEQNNSRKFDELKWSEVKIININCSSVTKTDTVKKHENFVALLGDTQLNMDQINQKSRKLHVKIEHCVKEKLFNWVAFLYSMNSYMRIARVCCCCFRLQLEIRTLI